jgi:hypothetical protein
MSWALFGYKENDFIGDFIAEANTKSELDKAVELAKEQGYITFTYSHADGAIPEFTKTLNI